MTANVCARSANFVPEINPGDNKASEGLGIPRQTLEGEIANLMLSWNPLENGITALKSKMSNLSNSNARGTDNSSYRGFRLIECFEL